MGVYQKLKFTTVTVPEDHKNRLKNASGAIQPTYNHLFDLCETFFISFPGATCGDSF